MHARWASLESTGHPLPWVCSVDRDARVGVACRSMVGRAGAACPRWSTGHRPEGPALCSGGGYPARFPCPVYALEHGRSRHQVPLAPWRVPWSQTQKGPPVEQDERPPGSGETCAPPKQIQFNCPRPFCSTDTYAGTAAGASQPQTKPAPAGALRFVPPLDKARGRGASGLAGWTPTRAPRPP